MQASLLCDVDVDEIKSVEVVDTTPREKSLLVTLKNSSVAEALHNSGRGNRRFYNSEKFDFFPVKKSSWIITLIAWLLQTFRNIILKTRFLSKGNVQKTNVIFCFHSSLNSIIIYFWWLLLNFFLFIRNLKFIVFQSVTLHICSQASLRSTTLILDYHITSLTHLFYRF